MAGRDELFTRRAPRSLTRLSISAKHRSRFHPACGPAVQIAQRDPLPVAFSSLV